MAWTKLWDGFWYNTNTQEYRNTTSDPNEEEAAQLAKMPKWIREGWQIVSGDASGSGVSQTSVINPATGKAESLIEVASAPDSNGIKQSLGPLPYSEYLALKASDPSVNISRILPSPENSMVGNDILGQIVEGVKEVAPVALAMYGGANALSGLLSGAGDAALAGLDAAQFGTSAAPVSIGGSGLSSGSVLDALSNASQYAGGGNYGGNTTMPDVVPQVTYNPPATDLLGGGLQLPSTTTAADLGAGAANPTSNMGFNTAGVNTGAGSTIGQGLNAGAYLPTFGGTFSTDGVTVSATNPAAALGTGAATIPSATSTGSAIPTAIGAGAAAAGLGSGSNTVTSSGDVDLTGVGTNPNPYNVDTATAASNTAISRILNGTATADDWAKITGQALPGLLGAYASSQQANTLQSLADRYAAYGAPSRARYEASMTPGFDPTTIPGYKGALDTASDSLLRRLSATGGNPYGNPGGLIEANKAIVSGTALPAIQEYQRTNAGAGGLANLAAAYPATQNSAAGANSNIYNSLGVAAADIFNPRQSLNDLLKSMQTSLA